MTREEIRERAVQIGDDVEITSTHEEWNATVEMHIAKIVRATLEEAARAVCERCETDAPAYDPECGWWYHTDLIGCDATPIHGLLAAMDKEGEHE